MDPENGIWYMHFGRKYLNLLTLQPATCPGTGQSIQVLPGRLNHGKLLLIEIKGRLLMTEVNVRVEVK